jgi:uncharacterized protein
MIIPPASSVSFRPLVTLPLETLLLVFCAGGPSIASAASFACGKAQGIEKMICADVALSRLDDELSIAYRISLRSDLKRDETVSGERKWIIETRNRCENEGCLSRVYRERIALLQNEIKWKGVPCNVQKSELIGDWQQYKDGNGEFEAFTIELDGNQQLFTSWLHGSAEFLGSWDLKGCTLYLINEDRRSLDTDFTVLGFEKGLLYLKDNGRGESSLYRKVTR